MSKTKCNEEFEYFIGLNENNSSRSCKAQTPDQLNTTFPLALLHYMHNENLNPNYLSIENQKWNIEEVDIEHILGDPNTNCYDFEATSDMCESPLPRADVIFSNKPFELKFAVVPDNSTKNNDADKVAPEMVIRPDTIAYLAAYLTTYNMENVQKAINKLAFQNVDWNDPTKIIQQLPILKQFMYDLALSLEPNQNPFLYLPVWKCDPNSQKPYEDCFDAFFFTDAAFTYLISDLAVTNNIGRVERSMVWLYLLLEQKSSIGTFDYKNTFAKYTMNCGSKTDKAFQVNGKKMHKYLACSNLTKPRIKWSSIGKIMKKKVVVQKRIFADVVAKHYPTKKEIK